ncbi:MAG: hypothetical protein AB7S26_20495 [Sandaracinaceae bacterium]
MIARFVALVVALFALPALGSAQAPARDVSLSEARARSMFDRAIDELERGHAAAGRDLLRASLAILPTVATRFNLAVALRETGELTEARVHLDALAADGTLTDDVRARVEQLRAEIDGAVGTLVVSAEAPSDAPDAPTRVEVDGVEVGEIAGEPLRVAVDPGEHRVTALLRTFRGTERVVIPSGETRRVQLTLTPFAESSGVEAWPFIVAGSALAVVAAVVAVIVVVLLDQPAHPEAITVPALVERF